jgi:hypothetical protein
VKSRAGYTVLAFACSNRASGSTHRSSQSNANAVLIPSKFNAFPQHTLSSGCFLSSPLSSFIQVSEETVLSLSLRCEDTHTRENREQAKQRRTSSSLSLSSAHRSPTNRAFTVSKRNRIAHHFHTRRRSIFSSEPIGRTVSFSLSLSPCQVSLFLCI